MRFAIVIFAAVFALTAAEYQSYDGYQVVTIKVDLPATVDLLFQWQEQGIDFWDSLNSIGRPTRVMIPPHLLEEFPAFLRENEISYELSIPNVETVIAEERRVNMERRAIAMMKKANSPRATADFSYYWQTEEINEYLRELADEFPHLVTLEVAGHGYEGRVIYVLKISNTNFDGTKPKIFIDSTIHAREWIAPMATLYLIHEMVQHSANYPELYDCDWIIIPVANPDGYQFSHDSTRMWRKNRAINQGSICRGVDGNRNYRYRWGTTGISTNPCSDVFLGPAPLSEPETQIVSNELAKEAGNIRLYLSVHSFGDMLLFPWGYERIYHANRDQLFELGDYVSDAIFNAHGRRYIVGNSATVLSPASGGSDDYAAAEHHIDLAYTIELTGGQNNGFDLPPEQIIPVSGEMFTGFRAYARYIAEHY
ncbi:carboxypeptidase B-like [Phlebotomus argentipes]|uniref:carboxypeptidase B-like n=1 Tax=Phlebotomus argentipes TaxID=94469 RepID=UPI002892FF76|nr:carboxypeptidase B-like [Phlebotomus argentipes]